MNKIENLMQRIDEKTRLGELRKYKILDTLTEEDYDNITDLASIICEVPIALISFVDEDRQWFKSHKGINVSETAREYSFCAHAIDTPSEVMIVKDSRNDDRFKNNPFVTGDPNIVFYAGIPLVSENGYSLGTVCIIDRKPRDLAPRELAALKILSSQVMKLLELRKNNLELLSASQRLQLALDAGKLGSYDLDLQSGEMKTSSRCRENFGIDSHERFDFNRLLALTVPEDRSNMHEAVNEAIRNNTTFDSKYRIKVNDEEIRWIHASGLPVYNKQGEAVQMAGVTINITEQKNFTAELERLVVERTRELNMKNAELETMNKELQSFAYVSSHDLQEPLRKIQTFASRIMEKDLSHLSEQTQEYFERIQGAAKRMQLLIDDLLAYSRTASTERVYEYTDLNKIVNVVKDDLKEEIQQKKATIITSELCHVKIIPFQFRQLVQNLFSNSIKFSRPEVPLEIRVTSNIDSGSSFDGDKLSSELKYCHIVVSDNGIGFDQQYCERIFELFERLNGKHEYSGTGIGLSIVKKIVENHRGVITAKSSVNNGASFNIYIPID